MDGDFFNRAMCLSYVRVKGSGCAGGLRRSITGVHPRTTGVMHASWSRGTNAGVENIVAPWLVARVSTPVLDGHPSPQRSDAKSNRGGSGFDEDRSRADIEGVDCDTNAGGCRG